LEHATSGAEVFAIRCRGGLTLETSDQPPKRRHSLHRDVHIAPEIERLLLLKPANESPSKKVEYA
jgi:hypothetical protein